MRYNRNKKQKNTTSEFRKSRKIWKVFEWLAIRRSGSQPFAGARVLVQLKPRQRFWRLARLYHLAVMPLPLHLKPLGLELAGQLTSIAAV